MLWSIREYFNVKKRNREAKNCPLLCYYCALTEYSSGENYELLKTGLNNVVAVVLPILFSVVNNIVQHCYT